MSPDALPKDVAYLNAVAAGTKRTTWRGIRSAAHRLGIQIRLDTRFIATSGYAMFHAEGPGGLFSSPVNEPNAKLAKVVLQALGESMENTP